MSFENRVVLSRHELEKIVEMVSQFPKVDKFSLIEQSCGIGDNLLLQFNITINEVSGTFSTEISGVETW